MEKLRPDHVEARQEGGQGDLSRLHEKARDWARLKEAHADNEMHALILSLLEERKDEAVIALELP